MAPLAATIRLYRRSHGHSGHTGSLGEQGTNLPSLFLVSLDPSPGESSAKTE